VDIILGVEAGFELRVKIWASEDRLLPTNNSFMELRVY